MLTVSRLDTSRRGRKWIPQPPWTVASWLQERKKRFPTAARRAGNEARVKAEVQEPGQDSNVQVKTLVPDQQLGQVKQEIAAETQSKATQLIQQIREAKRQSVAEPSTTSRKEAMRWETFAGEEIDT